MYAGCLLIHKASGRWEFMVADWADDHANDDEHGGDLFSICEMCRVTFKTIPLNAAVVA